MLRLRNMQLPAIQLARLRWRTQPTLLLVALHRQTELDQRDLELHIDPS